MFSQKDRRVTSLSLVICQRYEVCNVIYIWYEAGNKQGWVRKKNFQAIREILQDYERNEF